MFSRTIIQLHRTKPHTIRLFWMSIHILDNASSCVHCLYLRFSIFASKMRFIFFANHIWSQVNIISINPEPEQKLLTVYVRHIVLWGDLYKVYYCRFIVYTCRLYTLKKDWVPPLGWIRSPFDDLNSSLRSRRKLHNCSSYSRFQ